MRKLIGEPISFSSDRVRATEVGRPLSTGLATICAVRPRLISDEVLLDAALKAFAELGYEGASIRALCRHLGVSHNTLNQRFGSKDTLWHAAVDHGFKQLVDTLLDTIAGAGADPFNQVRATLLTFLSTTRAKPHLVQIISQESALPGERYDYLFNKYVAPINEMGLRPLRALQEQGKVRSGPITTIFFYLTTMGLGLMSSHPETFGSLGDHDADVAAAAELAVDMVMDSLRVPG